MIWGSSDVSFTVLCGTCVFVEAGRLAIALPAGLVVTGGDCDWAAAGVCVGTGGAVEAAGVTEGVATAGPPGEGEDVHAADNTSPKTSTMQKKQSTFPFIDPVSAGPVMNVFIRSAEPYMNGIHTRIMKNTGLRP